MTNLPNPSGILETRPDAERPKLVLHTLVLSVRQMMTLVGNAWGDDLLLQYHEGPLTFTFNPDNSAEEAHQRLIERMRATSLSLRTFADNPRDLPRIQYRRTVDATVFWLRFFKTNSIAITLETPFPAWIRGTVPPLISYFTGEAN